MPAQICASATLFPLIAPIAGDYISIDHIGRRALAQLARRSRTIPRRSRMLG